MLSAAVMTRVKILDINDDYDSQCTDCQKG